ncbi:MAG: hypothetical protein ABJF11_04220 [Reichenbachiella sp.]|uniref:hypothetical protein n=1 Tax=Reichenbachiella sp. TaxID=2184521 RepID=UPI003267057D
MKRYTLLLAISLLPLSIMAQPDFSSLAKEKISQLDLMVGTWKGMGYMWTQAGKDSSHVVENIQYKLDSTILFIEGQGTKVMEDGSKMVVHDALGIMSFHPFLKEYQMTSFISKGMSTVAKVKIIDAENIIWSFNSGPVSIRYSITIANNQWTEIGERSMDGQNWMKFFEMKLSKVN